MFEPALHTCNDVKAVRMFRAQFEVSRLRPVGAAAVVQVPGVNKGTYNHFLSVSNVSTSD